jgi:hypothetical protein
MMKGTVKWNGERAVVARMAVYEKKVLEAVRGVADYFAPILEAYAKDHAPWTDETGNARQGLHGFVQELAKDVVAVYLAHGMDYGIHLERRWAGKYAIILPTLQAHYGEVAKMLQGIFG